MFEYLLHHVDNYTDLDVWYTDHVLIFSENPIMGTPSLENDEIMFESHGQYTDGPRPDVPQKR